MKEFATTASITTNAMIGLQKELFVVIDLSLVLYVKVYNYIKMKRILVVDHGDASALAAIRERYPDAEVITPEEAKERNIVVDKPMTYDYPIYNREDIPILETVFMPRKESNQPWKRRGKNIKR